MKHSIFWLLLLIFLTTPACTFAQRFGQTTNSIKQTININGTIRTYYVFIPTNLPKEQKSALVLVFHGGGGNALQMERFSKFSQLAEKEKFIAVYPESINKNWNDGREFLQSDDLSFVKMMLDALLKNYKIDEKRIFSTGMSNGAFFSNYLAANHSQKLAAIAPVVGGIAEPFAPQFSPKEPVSVFIIQGTDDPLVPYNGGSVARNRGRMISTDHTIELWTKHNQTVTDSIKGTLPDADANDGCTVETYLWAKGKNSAEVKLYKKIGGGHTWAGGIQYLPKFMIGNVCRDFDATQAIWEFFKTHPKR
jgi:polyhydroxybutyrate depolymerase